MKRKGFTLIELLAVIVILAIIALISTPIIISVLERARKGAFEDSAYGIINAAKLYYADTSLNGGVTSETFSFPDDTKLKISGERPKSGGVTLDEEGKVEIAISNGVWCATKRKDEEKVTIIDYNVGECEITGDSQDDTTPESCFVMGYVSYTDFDINYEKCMESFNDEAECTNQPHKNYSGLSMKEYLLQEKNVELLKIYKQRSIIENIQSVTDENALAGYKCTDAEIVIPNKVNGKTVEKIGYRAFYAHQNVTSIVLPDTITDIGEEAFYQTGYGEYLSSGIPINIIIPNSVINIETGAFRQCPLQSVIIGNQVKSIGPSAFEGGQLTNITVPDSVTDIGKFALAANKLVEVKLGKSVTNIEEGTFSNNLLTTLEIPSNIANIQKNAFSYNKLETVKLTKGLIGIGEGAFRGNQLTSITIPEDVVSIGNSAFLNNNFTKVIVNKPENSITGSPWGASSVEWNG